MKNRFFWSLSLLLLLALAPTTVFGAPLTINWVGNMWPVAGSTTNASTVTVYVQVYKPGVTPGSGQGSGINCYIHWGVTGQTWQDIAMVYNPTPGASVGTDNDEYFGTIAPSSAGTYGFTTYCTDDGGTTKKWLGLADGTLISDGGGSTATPAPTNPPVPTITPGGPTVTPQPTFSGGGGVTYPARTVYAHMFEWKWTDIATECEQWLGPKGYKAVQVSPPNEHRKINVNGDYPWWQRYQAVSYNLVSRSGSEAEFVNMVQRCKASGVSIYVDAIVNHMSGLNPGETSGTYGSAVITQGNGVADYSQNAQGKGKYSPNHFHYYSGTNQCQSNISNYNDLYQVVNCELLGLDDLNTGDPYVQTELKSYMNYLLSLGVAGFRVDAVKHMSVDDYHAIMSGLNGWNTPNFFSVGEFIQGEGRSGSEYTQTSSITEFRYGYTVSGSFTSGNISGLLNNFYGGFLPSDKAVVHTDNHDNQRGHGGGGSVITFQQPELFRLANIFILAHPYGYPQIMSSYYFNTGDQGPPTNGNGDTKTIFSGTNPTGCGHPNAVGGSNNNSGWVCEHRWLAMGNMVGFRDFTNGEPMVGGIADGADKIAFGRGAKGFVMINDSSGAWSRSFATGLAAGQYCDVIHGNLSGDGQTCSGPIVTVDGSGNATVNVPAKDGVAIHIGQKISTVTNTPSATQTASATATQTASATATATNTTLFTATATETGTPTATATATIIPVTATATNTDTATATATTPPDNSHCNTCADVRPCWLVVDQSCYS
jgi:alpha-amylase